MLKTILLMRHAAASDGYSAQRDFDRHLTEDGRLAAQKTGECLRSLRIRIDRVIASSALRTKETAEITGAEACPESPLVLLDSLYNAPSETIATSISTSAFEDEQGVLVVGHNPGIAGLMCHWAEHSLAVPPSTLAIYQFNGTGWNAVRQSSKWRPRLVGIIQEGEILRQDESLQHSQWPQE